MAKQLITALALLVLLAGCESMNVSPVQPQAAPVAFSTYAWGRQALEEDSDAPAQLVELDQELREVLTAFMHSRGYQLVTDPARADMLMDYQVVVIEEPFIGEYHDPSWDAQFNNNTPANMAELPVLTSAPQVTVTLGLGQPDGPAIWGGTASELLVRPESASERRRLLNSAARQLLRSLPPRGQ